MLWGRRRPLTGNKWIQRQHIGTNNLLYWWVPLVGPVLVEFICVMSNVSDGDDGSVGNNIKEIKNRPPEALTPPGPIPSLPKKGASTNLGRALPTLPDIVTPSQRRSTSARRPLFYGHTKATTNSVRRTQKPKVIANSKFTRAKSMWQLGRVIKPDYQHLCNQIHLHQQPVNNGKMEPEAFQTAIGTLMKQLTKSNPGSKIRSGSK